MKIHHSFILYQKGWRILSVGFEIFLDHVMCWTLSTPISDNTGGTFDNLPGFALLVDLAEPSPLAQLHVAVHLDEGDAVLHAQRRHQLLVLRLVAVLGQDTQQRLTLVQRLGGLADAAGEAVSDQGLLEDLLQGRVNVHGATGGHGGLGWNISFNIAHVEILNVPDFNHFKGENGALNRLKGNISNTLQKMTVLSVEKPTFDLVFIA